MTGTITYYAYPTPVGKVTIAAEGGTVIFLGFGDLRLNGRREPSAVTNQAANELQAYFAGKRRGFDIPLAPRGTAFQRRVWEAVQAIPYGSEETPRAVAEAIGSPQSFRAVGTAVNRNPIAILIPTHRVRGAKGPAAAPQLLRREQGFLS